ncbi:outer membrane protein OmpA-like peptidoglycan-associated protein [Algoriphagus sp. 4150]|uniref:OmpA family protein n=1 Tax=Algoriphagus sp. 4150 TaxID=2817756 RepID=UPI0028578A2A|nr:OmpA family protein [Algoriphagus sp. 4150]MDR7132223.1 outer membrane protein OmpA-like peptidoglycan-associated protein [Algoriphagus sp. 4150]
MKKMIFSLLAIFLLYTTSYAMSLFSSCEEKALFSPLSNHKVSFCEEKAFDNYDFRYVDDNGNTQSYSKSGEYTKISYAWKGEFEQRPSKEQIFKNYENAVLQAGGEVLYNYTEVNFHLKKGGYTFYIQVNTDYSGTYEVITLKEAPLDQEVFMTAATIQKLMEEDGQVNFYGIYFDIDKSHIKPESEAVLKEIAGYLNSNPKHTVFFVGHTDLTGSLEHNQKLSELRAQEVVKTLIEKHSVTESRMKAFGIGPLSPMSSNSTEEGKAKNRRVVMVLSN